MLQTLASTRIEFELEFRFGPFWVQIHLGLNLIKDWTLWANPWLTNGLIKDLIPILKNKKKEKEKGALDSLSSSHVRTPKEKNSTRQVDFFSDAVPTKIIKYMGNVLDKRERDWFIKNPDKDYLLKIGDFSWKERNNG